MAGRAVLQVDQAASADQAVLRDIRKRGENPDLDRRLGLRPRRHRQEAPQARSLALHIAPGPLGQALRKTTVRSTLTNDAAKGATLQITNQLDLFAY